MATPTKSLETLLIHEVDEELLRRSHQPDTGRPWTDRRRGSRRPGAEERKA
jgi:hypothetical protein